MKKEYLVVSSKTGNQIVLVYAGGNFESLRIVGDWDEGRLAWLFRRVPFHEELILEAFGGEQNVKLREIPQDLSFEAFWNAYGNKVGKKVTTENTWSRLSKQDKTLAIAAITSYDNYLRRKQTVAKAYPSTYLSQRYWENNWNSAS